MVMIGSFRGLVVLSASGLALAVVQYGGPTASALTVPARYATPTGSMTASCAQNDPCDLITAINDASGGGTVHVEGGNYYKAAPTTTELKDAGNVKIIGPTAGQPAVIYSAADYGITFHYASSISHVELVFSGGVIGLFTLDGTADHVAVLSTSGVACGTYGALSDSLCVATGDDANAIDLDSDGSGDGSSVTTWHPEIDNVTAIATGADSYGISFRAGDAIAMHAAITNTIAQGIAADLHTNLNDETSTHPADTPPALTVRVSHSDFHTKYTERNGTQTSPSATIQPDTTNISAAPKFTHSATTYYSEAANSPTINRGVKVVGADTDLLGYPRTLGATTDIGAYEFPQAPAVSGLKVTSTKATMLGGKVTINGEGFAAYSRLLVTRNGHRIATINDPHHPTQSRLFKFAVVGLKPNRIYRLQVVTENNVGTTHSAKLTVRTKKKPPPHHDRTAREV
jgi:hypothetical protein